jgi:hypothetical protein
VTRNFTASGKPHVYSVYYGKKDESDKLGLKFNHNGSIEEQISKIKLHFEALANIRNQYE